MASSNVIREFLVSIGFKIQNEQLQNFTRVIADATKLLTVFTTVAEGAGVSVTTAVGAIARSMEQLYYASARTGASVQNIQSFAFAVGQMGGSAQSARGSLEAFAMWLRSSPGAINVVRSLGVTATDTTAMLQQLGTAFSHMPFYRALAYGQLMGIDYPTLIALTNGVEKFSAEYQKMYRAAGLDGQQGAKASHSFMNEIRLTVAALEILAQKVATLLVGGVGNDIRKFRDAIVQNFTPVSEIIARVARGIIWLADVTARFAVREVELLRQAYDWFSNLSDRGKALIETLGGLLIAWQLLNTGFLRSPIGILITSLEVLLALFDDFRTWQEGGKSLIDWTKWAPKIKEFQGFLHDLGDSFEYLADRIGNVGAALTALVAILLARRTLGALASLLGIGAGAGAGASTAAGAGGLLGSLGLLARRGGFGWLSAIAGMLALWSVAKPGLEHQADQHPNQPGSLWDALKESWKSFLHEHGGSVGERRRQGLTGNDATLPRGIRNNNPGNLEFANQEGATREPGSGRFAAFPTMAAGVAALGQQLHLYAARHIDTVRSIISTYAPSNENDTGGYIAQVARMLGVSPDAHLDLDNPNILHGLERAIISQENGARWGALVDSMTSTRLGVSPGDHTAEPHGGAAGAGTHISAPQHVNITVNGTGDAHETASRVAGAQRNVNSDLVRNLQAVTV